jgi:hypothetical protein
MRRGVSIFLVLLFSLGPVSAALRANRDAGLPPCCRRLGAHRCAMSGAVGARVVAADSNRPILSAPSHCRYYPADSRAKLSPACGLALPSTNQLILPEQDYASAAPTRAARLSPWRTRADRGPPSSDIG